MIIVVAFPKGEDGHEPMVAGGALAGIGLLAQYVAERVDEESGVLYASHASHSPDEEAPEEALGGGHYPGYVRIEVASQSG